MVFLNKHCISCAYWIGGGKAWTQRFRASKRYSYYSIFACCHHSLDQKYIVYSTPDGVRLSGIGLRNHIEDEFLVLLTKPRGGILWVTTLLGSGRHPKTTDRMLFFSFKISVGGSSENISTMSQFLWSGSSRFADQGHEL